MLELKEAERPIMWGLKVGDPAKKDMHIDLEKGKVIKVK